MKEAFIDKRFTRVSQGLIVTINQILDDKGKGKKK